MRAFLQSGFGLKSVSKAGMAALASTGSVSPPDPAAQAAALSDRAGDSGALRILYIVDTLNIGGTETQMVEAALRCHAMGHQLTVACLRDEGPLRDALQQAGIPLIEFRKGKTLLSLNGLRQLLRMVVFLRRHKFQVVHSHDLWSNLLGVPAAWLARIPVIISSRRYLADLEWYTPRRNKIVRALYHLSTHVVVNSGPVRDLLLERDGVPARKVRVLHNAVDAGRIAGVRQFRERSLPDIQPSPKLIAVVANMYSAVKGHTHLIAAAGTICRLQPETFFLLIGDGPERPRLEEQVRARNLERNFLFMGRRTDVAELLACCDLSVLPSEAEALPNALLEAMACGLPVVATSVGGVPEVIENGLHGLLVPPRDPEAIAAAVLRVLSDPCLAMMLGRAAQQRIRARFSFDRLMTELHGLYSQSGAGKTISTADGVRVRRGKAAGNGNKEAHA